MIPTATRLLITKSAIDNLGYWLPKLIAELGGHVDVDVLEKVVEEASEMYIPWLLGHLKEKIDPETINVMLENSVVKTDIYNLLMEMYILKIVLEGFRDNFEED